VLARPLPPSRRLAILRALIVLLGVIFVAQLVRIQFVQGQGLRARADENRFRLVEVTGQRGVMYDRNGQLLVRNRPSFDVVAIPSNLPIDSEETRAILERLEEIIARSEANCRYMSRTMGRRKKHLPALASRAGRSSVSA
jgi:cell division protein FtsI/penicillin-binding protein 2